MPRFGYFVAVVLYHTPHTSSALCNQELQEDMAGLILSGEMLLSVGAHCSALSCPRRYSQVETSPDSELSKSFIIRLISDYRGAVRTVDLCYSQNYDSEQRNFTSKTLCYCHSLLFQNCNSMPKSSLFSIKPPRSHHHHNMV
jgi:hypothetical protein